MWKMVNFIAVKMDCQHKDFPKVAEELEKMGFKFHCVQEVTLRYIEICLKKNPIQIPFNGYEYRGIFNKNRFDDELISYIKKNHSSNGGCIIHYEISE